MKSHLYFGADAMYLPRLIIRYTTSPRLGAYFHLVILKALRFFILSSKSRKGNSVQADHRLKRYKN